MAENWKPGDVALWTGYEEDDQAASPMVIFRHVDLGSGDEEWMTPVEGCGYPALGTIRPLLVIDPENREQVVALLAAYGDQFTPSASGSNVDRLQAAIRSLLPKPGSDEPTGLGAVVKDGNGDVWTKSDPRPVDCLGDWFARTASHGVDWSAWADLPRPLTVLHEGWAEGER